MYLTKSFLNRNHMQFQRNGFVKMVLCKCKRGFRLKRFFDTFLYETIRYIYKKIWNLNLSNKLTYLNSEVNPIRLYAYTLTITCFLRACIRMEGVNKHCKMVLYFHNNMLFACLIRQLGLPLAKIKMSHICFKSIL